MALTIPTPAAVVASQDAGLKSALRSRRLSFGPVPREMINLVAVSLGLFFALQVGASIADDIDAYAPWLCMLCYVGPILIVSAMLWLVGLVIEPALAPTSRPPKI